MGLLVMRALLAANFWKLPFGCYRGPLGPMGVGGSVGLIQGCLNPGSMLCSRRVLMWEPDQETFVLNPQHSRIDIKNLIQRQTFLNPFPELRGLQVAPLGC